MKFDTARAMEWVGMVDFPRVAGTEGERRAAELVAAQLASLVLRGERNAAPGSRLPALVEPWLGWIGVGAWATGLAIVTHVGAAWPARLTLAVGALLWLRLTAVEGFRLGRLGPRRVVTTS